MGEAEQKGAGVRAGVGFDGSLNELLNEFLDELVGEVPGLRHAVLLSAVGLVTGASRGLSRADARHLASVAAGFHRVATDAGRRFGAGCGRRTTVELEAGGRLFVAAAGRDTCLAAIGTGEADPGVVSGAMDRLARRLGAPGPPGPPAPPLPSPSGRAGHRG
ncbi:roadblock/LC7 domain-containing protein [Streptomyces zingiberis]|uniref:Roadblock/LC7 domain-containing protein n=1 Tax=Streptomyces zingiberis TaxID=2053010 RepID=A0ABX1BZN5_9ACTN|nr:roadblock/LC7 domain-containing protein [Streptomyces zingiberis]NJQ00124.1 roadblock/LC7 domain-containing protein [Streptomyces zingiberis]